MVLFTPQPPTMNHTVAIRRLSLVVSGLVLLAALGGLGLSVAPLVATVPGLPKPAWTFVGFEAVMVVTASIGVLVGLGRFTDGVPAALGCVAGTTALASLLSYIGVHGTVAGIGLKPWLGARLLAAGLLAALAIVSAMGTNRRAWRLMLRGLALGLPVPAVGGWAFVVNRRGGSPMSVLAALPDGVRYAVLGVLTIAFGVMLCASVHLVMRAFEVARATGPDPAPPR